MFSKTPSNPPPTPSPQVRPEPTPAPLEANPQARRPGQKMASLVASDMTLEGNVLGGGELQVDGNIKGDVRVERVTVGETGQVDGGIFAEAVEVRGKVSGSITAKQVRLYGACHVDGDITHEQLAMETGAFFQGRSLRLQRPAAQPSPSVQPSASAQPSPSSQPAAAAQPAPVSTNPTRSEPATGSPPPVTTASLAKDLGNGATAKPGASQGASLPR